MAKFTRYLFGGIVGAGLAMLLTPKKGSEMRRLLKGNRQPAALPSPEMAAPVAAPEPVDLDARIEETRRQVEEELTQPYAGTVDEALPVEAEAEPAADVVPEDEPVVALPEAPDETGPGDLSWEDDSWAVPEAELPAQEVTEETADEPPVIIDDEITEEEEESSSFYQATPVPEAEEPAVIPEFEEDAAAEALLVEPEPVEEPEPAPAAEEPAAGADEMGMDYLAQPVEGEPEIDEPAAAAPEPDAPAPAFRTPEKASFDREAMRRRIEETRARLKAKAFDAMVQGESFVSTEAEADDAGDAVDLAPEAESAIEQTLREED